MSPMDNPDTIEDILAEFHEDVQETAIENDMIDIMRFEALLETAAAKLQRMQDEAVIKELERLLEADWSDELKEGYHRSHVVQRIEALRTNKEPNNE